MKNYEKILVVIILICCFTLIFYYGYIYGKADGRLLSLTQFEHNYMYNVYKPSEIIDVCNITHTNYTTVVNGSVYEWYTWAEWSTSNATINLCNATFIPV